MATQASNELVHSPRRFPWAWVVFIGSALVIPVSHGVVSSHSGERHFGQGLEGSLFLLAFQVVQVISFFGLLCASRLSSQSDNRKWLLGVLGVVAFLVVEFFSFGNFAFSRFPD